jgi:hypothetical protein
MTYDVFIHVLWTLLEIVTPQTDTHQRRFFKRPLPSTLHIQSKKHFLNVHDNLKMTFPLHVIIKQELTSSETSCEKDEKCRS